MSKADNTATQEGLAEAINGGDLDKMDDFFTADVVDHDPAPEQGPGPQGFKEFFAMMRRAFPDLHTAPDRVVVDDDTGAIAYTRSSDELGILKQLGVAPDAS